MNPTINPLMSNLLDKQIMSSLRGADVFDTKTFVPRLGDAIIETTGQLNVSLDSIRNSDYYNRIRFQLAMEEHGEIITPVQPYNIELLEIDNKVINLQQKCYHTAWPDIDASVYFMQVDNYGTKSIESLIVMPGPLNFQYITIKLKDGRFINSILSSLSLIIRRCEKYLSSDLQSQAYFLIAKEADSLKELSNDHVLRTIQVASEILRRMSACLIQQLIPTQMGSCPNVLPKEVPVKM